MSSKKSKTPHRSRATAGQLHINERTQQMANNLKRSVFELTRDDSDYQNRTLETSVKKAKSQYRHQHLSLKDTTNQRPSDHQLICPESPSILSVQAHAIPIVSAKMMFQQSSPEKNLQQSQHYGSPAKKNNARDKKTTSKYEHLSVEQLAIEFFR